jgi:uncharacterized membrane protein
MTNKSTTAKATSGNKSLTVQQHETDSPILPAAQLEKLHQFRPDIVDWVVSQTQIESEHRRKQDTKINTYIFIERVLGQVFALIIGLSGIGVGGYIAVKGEATAGATIASISITGLAVVFLTGRHSKK